LPVPFIPPLEKVSDPELLCSLDMAWAKPQYNRGRVDAAGDTLLHPPISSDEYETALSVINNWRTSHGYPLQCLKMVLLGRAKSIESKALIAQRLKRLPSIELKLKNNPHMKLSQMQDLGGCRAVVRSVHCTAPLKFGQVVSCF